MVAGLITNTAAALPATNNRAGRRDRLLVRFASVSQAFRKQDKTYTSYQQPPADGGASQQPEGEGMHLHRNCRHARDSGPGCSSPAHSARTHMAGSRHRRRMRSSGLCRGSSERLKHRVARRHSPSVAQRRRPLLDALCRQMCPQWGCGGPTGEGRRGAPRSPQGRGRE